MAKTFDAYGVESVDLEPHYHKHIRNIGVSWACQAHLAKCHAETSTKFAEFMDGTIPGFSSDHEATLFCNGILKATEKEFDFMWNLYRNSKISSRRRFYLRSIGCIESDKILTRFIASIVESDEVDNDNEEWLTIIQV